ncbi:hypothetical protein [Lentzea jiangxiensis]|uniref:hypothetical protein n=1 Tax=Lentzea jiangxiensis TaxID=641025 RepID=UPI00115F9A23|nr:hypothetical protein [Lentzea jiangxiensis]
MYDKDGFKIGPGGGVFADPTVEMTDSRDFESWDWKQIRAAVVGYAATPRDARPTSVPYADPNSIRHAATVFNRARDTLQFVSDNLRLQVEALAGENGAWQSPAAEVFRSINLHLAANLQAKADQINGGEVTGERSVPAQLWRAGNYLEWAQNEIKRIDSYYASYVRSQGGARMTNQLTKVSAFPELVDQMAEDMKKVVRLLANEYDVNTASVVVPSAVDFRPKGPGTGDGPGGDGNDLPDDLNIDPPPPADNTGGGDGTRGNTPPPPLNIGPPPGADLGGDGGGTGGGNNFRPPPSLNVEPPPGLDLSGGDGGGGTGGGNDFRPPPSLNVEPPPGLDLSGGNTGGGDGLPLPPGLDLSPPPGADVGTGGNNAGGTGGLGLPPAMNIAPPPAADGGTRGGGSGGGTALPKPPPLSLNTPPGVGSGTGNDSIGRPPQLDIEAPPGAGSGTGNDSTGLPPQLDIETPPGLGTGDDRGGTNLPPAAPMMPPAGAGGGAPAGANADRPDSSGLLGGLEEPWKAGSLPPAIDPSGTEPPAVKPEDWAASPSSGSSGGLGGGLGSQVPPPMMPPVAGGQPPGATGDRPDSSGLLGGEKESWEGTGLPVADLDAASPPPSIKPEEWASATGGSADAGIRVPAVGGPTTTEPPALNQIPEASEPAAQQVSSGGAGAGLGSQVPPPMMPPVAGGQPPGAAGDRPDSSGLLGGHTEPWAGAEEARGVGGASDTPASAAPEKWAVTTAEPVVTPATPAAEPPPAVEESAPVAPSAPPAVTPVVALARTPVESAAPERETAVPVLTEQAEKIAPTPAAAPAGWAASSGLVAAGQETPQAAAVLGASAVTAAAAFGAMTGPVPGTPPSGPTPPGAAPAPSSGSGPVGSGPGRPYPSEFPHVDVDGNVQDDREEDGGGGLVLRGGAAGALPGVDSVAVVRPDDAVKDVTAWDSGNAAFLLSGAPPAPVAAKTNRSGWDTEPRASGITLDSSEPWEPEPSTTHATYRRRRYGEAPLLVDDSDDEVWCGDEYSVPKEEREDFVAGEVERLERLRRQEAGEDVEDPEDGEDAEPEERSAADLLSRSSAAWGGSTAASPMGVLE